MKYPSLVEGATAKNVVQSFRSTKCPACGTGKAIRTFFCQTCWGKLSPETMEDLVRHKLGTKLEVNTDRVMIRAMRELGANVWLLPGPNGTAGTTPPTGGSHEQRNL